MRQVNGVGRMLGGILGLGLGGLALLLGVFGGGVSAPPALAGSPTPSSCGNAVVEAGEQCDPPGSSCTGAFAGQTCQADCQCGSAQPAILRHFQCYEVRPPQRFDDRVVSLDDQFRSFDATVKK